MAEVLFWLQASFGNEVFALLIGSSWRKIADKTRSNVGSFFEDRKNTKIPRQLKYETLSAAEVRRPSLLALLSSEFEDVIEEPP
jgi:hypothetical protein